VKETYIRDVHVGSPVDVWVDAYPSRIFRGIVESIGPPPFQNLPSPPPEFYQSRAAYPVRITVDSIDGLLKPGMMVIVGIEIPEEARKA